LVNNKAKEYMESQNISYEEAYKQAYNELYNNQDFFQILLNEVNEKMNLDKLAKTISYSFSYIVDEKRMKNDLKISEKVVEKLCSKYGIDYNDYMNLPLKYKDRVVEKFNYLKNKLKELQDEKRKENDSDQKIKSLYTKNISIKPKLS
jgi:hypothetical protein